MKLTYQNRLGSNNLLNEQGDTVAVAYDAVSATLIADAVNANDTLTQLLRDIRAYPDALHFRPDLIARINAALHD